MQMRTLVLAADQKKQLRQLAVRRAIRYALIDQPRHDETLCDIVRQRVARVRYGNARQQRRRAQLLALGDLVDQLIARVYQVGLLGQPHKRPYRSRACLGLERRRQPTRRNHRRHK